MLNNNRVNPDLFRWLIHIYTHIYTHIIIYICMGVQISSTFRGGLTPCTIAFSDLKMYRKLTLLPLTL